MTTPLRNRIKTHRRVRFGDLVPHELNPRLHPDHQRAALEQLYQEIGFARSLLAFELPDGRLKLIDGHLRASLTPDDILDVEVLDVTEDEARVLLLSIDPLAELVNYDAQLLDRLRQSAEADSRAVQMIWNACREEEKAAAKPAAEKEIPQNQFFILIACSNEEEQVELLERFTKEGFKCQAKIG